MYGLMACQCKHSPDFILRNVHIKQKNIKYGLDLELSQISNIIFVMYKRRNNYASFTTSALLGLKTKALTFLVAVESANRNRTSVFVIV